MFIVDGVRYRLWTPKDEEKEFHPIIKEHINEIFGQDAIYFDRGVQLRSLAGLGAKPEGFVIDLKKNEWSIVEVELSKHDAYSHIVDQLTRFINGIDNPQTRNTIVEAIYDEICKNKVLKAVVEEKVRGDVHHWLTRLINTTPKIVVVIEEKTQKVIEACKLLMRNFETYIIEFKTYTREDAPNVHSHLFEPLYEEEVEIVHARYDKSRNGFFCLMGDEKHNSILYDVVEIVKHVRDEHHINPEDQKIEGWTRKFERLWKEYERKEERAKLPPHRLNWEKRLQWVNPSVKTLVARLISKVEKEFPDVTHLSKYRWYYIYKGKSQSTESLFAVLMLTKKDIKVRIRTEPTKFEDPKGWTKVYKGWFFKRGQEREFKMTSEEQIPYAMELIKQSYDISGEH